MTIKIEHFEGPYDLLLSLIQDQKLDISEIALSKVTEQYLHYIDSLEKENPEELADFLLVATKLLLHKSRILLPQFGPQEEEGPSLEEQLRLYQRFVAASKKMNALWLGEQRAAYRVEPPRKNESFVPPQHVDLNALHESMVQLISRLAPPKALPQAKIDKTISLKQKIDHVRSLLRDKKSILFHEVLSSSYNKTELIVGFLALLELVKAKTVGLAQDEQFGDIVIQRMS